MARFTEIPFFIIKEFFDEYSTSSTPAITGSSIVLNPIVLSNSKEFELVMKVKITTDSEFYKYEYVNFNVVGYDEDRIIVEYVSGDLSTLENENEVYVRKNSRLYRYVSNNELYNASVFFNKDYFYIGKVQFSKVTDQYHVYIENLYKFSVSALPEYNRTDQLKEFLKLSFDNVYQEVYNKQKHLWSLIDPIETNKTYLNYIADIYNVNIDDAFIDNNLYTTRSFVRNLPLFLKRKGTYSSIFISSQFNTKNVINIYERWHPRFDWGTSENPSSTTNPESYFIDFNYLNYYSKELSGSCYDSRTVIDSDTIIGGGSPTPSNSTSLIHVQSRLSKTWVFSHGFNTNNFIWQCYDENFNKVLPLTTEFINENIVRFTFENLTSGYIFAITSDTTPLLLPQPSDIASWQFEHGLNTKYPSVDDIKKNMYPVTSYSIEDSGTVSTIPLSGITEETTFTEDILQFTYNDITESITAISSPSDYIHSQTEPTSAWTITHNLGNDVLGVVAQFYVSVPKTTFKIIHNINSFKLVIQCFDENDYLVMPSLITLLDENNIELLFSSEFSGIITITSLDDIDANDNISSTMGTSAISGSLTHGLDNKFNIISIYNSNDNTNIFERSIVPIDNNTIEYTFDDSVNATINVIKPDYTEHFDIPKSTWNINHDLNTSDLLVQCYVPDTTFNESDVWNINHDLNSLDLIIQAFTLDNKLITPKEVEIIDINNIRLTFEEPEIGYVHMVDANILSVSPEVVSEFENTYNYSISEVYNSSSKWFFPYEITLNYEKLTLFLSSITDAISGNVNIVPADWFWPQNAYSNIWYGDTFYEDPGIYQFYSNTLVERGGRWNMTHNFGEVLCFCYDKNNFSIPFSQITLSNTIATSSSNPYYEIEVDGLNDNEDGYISLSTGAKVTQPLALSTWNINHSLNTVNIIPQFFNTNGELLDIDTLVLDDADNLTVSFTQPASGYSLIAIGDSFDHESDDEWTIIHNLDTDGILYAVYNDTDNYLSSFITLDDNNSLTVSLTGSYSGRVVLKGVDLPLTQVYPEDLEILGDGRYKATFNDTIKGYSVYTEASQLQNLSKHDPYYIRHIDNNNTEISFNSDLKNGVVVIIKPDFTGRHVEKGIQPLTQTLYNGYLTATFDQERSGYCVVKNVGSIGYHGELIMSPHYRVELDLTCVPYNDKFVLPKEVIEMLLKSWEYVRPVSKYAHYNLYINPSCDFTERLISLYPIHDDYAAFYTQSVNSIFTNPNFEDIFLFRQNEYAEEWVVEHNFGKNALVQCFNNNREMILPNNIVIRDNNTLKVYFDESESGFALLLSGVDEEISETYITSGYSWTQSTLSLSGGPIYDRVGNVWVENSPLSGSITPFVQVYDYKNNFVIPMDITHFTETGKVVVDFYTKVKGLETLTGYSFRFNFTDEESTWVINHNLGYSGLIGNFFDEYGEEIIPDKFILENINTCIVEFSTPMNGHIILKGIGHIYTIESIIALLTNGYIKFGSGTSKETYNPVISRDLENPIIFNGSELITSGNLEVTHTLDESGNVRFWHVKGNCKEHYDGAIYEMGLFDEDNNLLFYSFFDQIYKSELIDFTVEYKLENTTE